MSLFRVVPTSIWHDRKFVELGSGQPDPQKLLFYLITCPDTCIVPGVYRATRGGLADGIRWSLDGFDWAFRELSDRNMVVADWPAQLVWLPNALKHQPAPNRCVVQGWVKALREMPECDLLEVAVAHLVEQLEAYDAAEQEAANGAKRRRKKKKEQVAPPLRALLDEMREKRAARGHAPRWAPHLAGCLAPSLTPCPTGWQTPCATPSETLSADVSRMVADASCNKVPNVSSNKVATGGSDAAATGASEAFEEMRNMKVAEGCGDASEVPETLENQGFAEGCAPEGPGGGHPVGQGAEQGLGQGTGYGVPDQDQDQDQQQDQDQHQDIDTHTGAREARADVSVDAAERVDSEAVETTETAARDEAPADASASVVDSKPATSSKPQESAAAAQAQATETVDAQADKPGFGYVASVVGDMRRGEAAVAEATEHEKALLVIGHYRKYHPRAHLKPNKNSKEWKKIKERLEEGYSVEDICLAIEGCHKSPFHMGKNETGTKHNSLELIVRSGSQVTKFAELAEEYPDGVPQPGSAKRDVRVGYHPGCTHDEHMETIRKYGVNFDGESAVIDLLKVAEEEIHA